MKVVVLLSSLMWVGLFGVAECASAPSSSFAVAGTLVEVRCDAIAPAVPSLRSVAPGVAAVSSVVSAERGPEDWQKDRETLDRERLETLDSELGASNE